MMIMLIYFRLILLRNIFKLPELIRDEVPEIYSMMMMMMMIIIMIMMIIKTCLHPGSGNVCDRSLTMLSSLFFILFFYSRSTRLYNGLSSSSLLSSSSITPLSVFHVRH